MRLYEDILVARETHLHSLPEAPEPLIGREEALSHTIDELIDPACRLLTLVGQGGVGKSRLALEVARKLDAACLYGVCYVPLSTVNSVDGLIDAIARAARYPYQNGRDPHAELLRFLEDKEMLLLLDNFEQFVAERALVSDVLAHAPALKLLVTSRMPLNLRQETTVLSPTWLRMLNNTVQRSCS